MIKLADRKNHIENTIVKVGKAEFGGNSFQFIAGPCTIESRTQMIETAEAVKNAGATVLRGGAFKPRTSPYSFQGLGEEGLKYLSEAKALTGLPTVSEIMDASQLELFKDVDILQVGAKNMQNYSLLKALGAQDKPVLLKRGFVNTIEEFLESAEYILLNGNSNVILCERGVRTFDTETRFSLDLSMVPVLKEKTHLPVIVDPSHATGHSGLIRPMSRAATAVGSDGLMIEVHDDPFKALCDGPQAVGYDEFRKVVEDVSKIKNCLNEI